MPLVKLVTESSKRGGGRKKKFFTLEELEALGYDVSNIKCGCPKFDTPHIPKGDKPILAEFVEPPIVELRVAEDRDSTAALFYALRHKLQFLHIRLCSYSNKKKQFLFYDKRKKITIVKSKADLED